ncbi:MAG: ROK family protein [Spirochaetales bacterium]|nr:MAG: ROK family protein [Spirochaetales bacterium]
MIFLAAVDIGGTKITASICNEDSILSKIYQPTCLTGDPLTVPKQVAELVERACREAGIGKDSIHALGISSAGPFVRINGFKAMASPNLCGNLGGRQVAPNNWGPIEIEAFLKPGFRQFSMGNDAATAAVAEHRFGAGRGFRHLAYITWSTGIGMGIIHKGRLLGGKNGNAGHGGHLYISTEDGPLCGCGQYGDLEAFTSGTALARDYGEEGITARDIFSRYRKGEEKAEGIIRKAARIMGRALAAVNNLLDLELFVIGGSVFMHNQDLLKPLLMETFGLSFPALSGGVEIKASELDNYLGDIAALSLVMPENWIVHWQKNRPWEKAPEAVILSG